MGVQASSCRDAMPWTSGSCPFTPHVHHQVGRLHGSVPNLSRYLESRDSSGHRGLPPPDYAHLQRSFWALAQKGKYKLGGSPKWVKRSGKEGSDVWPAPAVHNSLSSVLVALTTERDRLRDLHQGSELSRMAVSSGTWQLTGGRA